MKKFILCFLITICSITAYSQVGPDKPDGYIASLPIVSGKITFSGKDTVNASANELFLRAKDYFSSVLNNYKYASLVEDKDLGKLSVRGLFQLPPPKAAIAFVALVEFTATTTIYVKDGKYKYEITDLVDPSGGYNWPLEARMNTKKRAEKISNLILPYIDSYVSSIKSAMNSSTKDSW